MRERSAEARARRVLSALVRLYPPAFRFQMGTELVDTSLHQWREAVRRRGIAGAAWFWATEGVRFAFDGVAERMVVLGQVAHGTDPALLQVGRTMEIVVEPIIPGSEEIVWKWKPVIE